MQKHYRLCNTRSFNYVHKKGKSIANKDIVLLFVPTKYNLKVGFSVSKKVGKAVVRNKVRRRLKEGFRALIPFIDKSNNYIVMARVGADKSDYHLLLAELKDLLKRANLIVDFVGINTII